MGMSKKKLPTNEKMLELATSGKVKDLKKFIEHWAHAGRLKMVEDGRADSVQNIIVDGYEMSHDHGAVEEMDGQTHYGLKVSLVDCGPQHDGESFEDTYSITQDGSDDVLVYFRIGGYYDSYDGVEWNDIVAIVKPYATRTIVYLTDDERKGSDAEFI
jgi:hypothetical protein